MQVRYVEPVSSIPSSRFLSSQLRYLLLKLAEMVGSPVADMVDVWKWTSPRGPPMQLMAFLALESNLDAVEVPSFRIAYLVSELPRSMDAFGATWIPVSFRALRAAPVLHLRVPLLELPSWLAS